MTARPSIADIGRALYGGYWQNQLARDLGVSDRTIRYWLSGDMTPREGVFVDLEKVCQDRAAAISAIAKRIKGKS